MRVADYHTFLNVLFNALVVFTVFIKPALSRNARGYDGLRFLLAQHPLLPNGRGNVVQDFVVQPFFD